MIILYTIDCPKCKVLERKLEEKNIQYEVCKDTNIMAEKGYMYLPILEIDDKVFNFKEAVDWIKEK